MRLDGCLYSSEASVVGDRRGARNLDLRGKVERQELNYAKEHAFKSEISKSATFKGELGNNLEKGSSQKQGII
jgi:hypothetical protein